MYIEKLTPRELAGLKEMLSDEFYAGKNVEIKEVYSGTGLWQVFVDNEKKDSILDHIIPNFAEEDMNCYYISYMANIFGEEYINDTRKFFVNTLKSVTNAMNNDLEVYNTVNSGRLKSIAFHTRLLTKLEKEFDRILSGNKVNTQLETKTKHKKEEF